MCMLTESVLRLDEQARVAMSTLLRCWPDRSSYGQPAVGTVSGNSGEHSFKSIEGQDLDAQDAVPTTFE